MFCNKSHDTAWANTVTAHNHPLARTIFIGVIEIKRIRKLRSQCEDITHLNCRPLNKLVTVHTKIGQNLIVIHLFVNGNFLAFMNIYLIFANWAKCLELMAILREAPATCKGLVGNFTKTQTCIYTVVRIANFFIKCVVLFLSTAKAIQVFHPKLASTHQATLTAKLVAELDLELVWVYWQVLVTANKALHELRQRVFVRWRQTKLTATRELRLEPNIHHFIIPASRSLPDILLLEGCQTDLATANSVHLFANDVDNLIKNNFAEWQIVIHTGHLFMNKASSDKQLGILCHLISRSGFTCFCK
ncbi:hypothetical protein D3C85_996250 [compost metagenome]